MVYWPRQPQTGQVPQQQQQQQQQQQEAAELVPSSTEPPRLTSSQASQVLPSLLVLCLAALSLTRLPHSLHMHAHP